MLTVISPSKTLQESPSKVLLNYNVPALLSHSKMLMDTCKNLSADDIAKLMKISPKLADLNYARFQSWNDNFNLDNASRAILTFKGDVYEGLNADDFALPDFEFASTHLVILSGLYGLLRPLDLIKPYRLEMGIKLKIKSHQNLYQFWGETITNELNNQLDESNATTLINLASNEYFKAVKTKNVHANIITPTFLDEKNGTYKVISFYAKKARGLMSRFIIKHKLTNPDDLRSFNSENYQFNDELSDASHFVFTRREQGTY